MSTPYINKCANCEIVVQESDLNEIKDLFQRVMPGGTMPSGQCPHCGSLCFLEKTEARQVVIHVRQLVPDDQLGHDDRVDKVAGKYTIDVPAQESLPVAASIALDEFHSSVPISGLDDFQITCEIDGEEVSPSGDEDYAHTGEGLSKITKEVDYLYDGNRYSVYIQVPFGIRVNSIGATNQEEAVNKAFDFVADLRESFSQQRYPGQPGSNERFFDQHPWVEYGEIAEDNFVAALVDSSGDPEFEDSIWFEPDPQNGDKVIPLGSVATETKAAIEQAIVALLNVPEVGCEYDQQHSDSHMSAYLRLKDLLGKPEQ